MIDISESRAASQVSKVEEEPILYSAPESYAEPSQEPSQEEEDAAEERFFLRRFSWRKLSITSYVMLGCIGLMFLCVVLSLAAPEHTLLTDAFEAFKMIALVVLGYIFGTNSNNNSHHNA